MKQQSGSLYLVNCALILILCANLHAQSNGAPATVDEQTAPPQQTSNKINTEEKPRVVYESATVLKATTRLVVLDVVATDHQGRAVTDLAAKDFTVLEEGKPQQLRIFTLQQEKAFIANEPAHKLPANVFTNVPDYKPNGALNIILVDSLNTTLLNQAETRRQMIGLLEKLPVDHPIAVYALGQKLFLLQDFTTDPGLLQNAVRALKEEDSPLLENPTGGRPPQYLTPYDAAILGPIGVARFKAFVKNVVEIRTDDRVRRTLDALNSLARNLAAYPGRKNLIWVSEEFPLILDPANHDYSYGLAKTADALMSAQVAVYTVDARGVATSDAFNAGNGGYDSFGGSIRGPALHGFISKENTEIENAHDTMSELAEKTGGKAFYNLNAFDKAVRQSLDDGSQYYILGYYPADKHWNGKFRKIKIKAARADVKLRYRFGYFATDPTAYQKEDPKQQARDFGQALSLDYPVSTALLFEAGVLPPSAKTRNKVVVNYLIDAHAISFQKEHDDLQHALLDCAVQIYSDKGELFKTEVTSIKTALQPEIFQQVMRNNLPCQVTFDLSPGNYILRLGIRDNRTGLIGSGNATVTVGVQK
jgi:VWFA-related protein